MNTLASAKKTTLSCNTNHFYLNFEKTQLSFDHLSLDRAFDNLHIWETVVIYHKSWFKKLLQLTVSEEKAVYEEECFQS